MGIYGHGRILPPYASEKRPGACSDIARLARSNLMMFLNNSDTVHIRARQEQEIWANAHGTRDSISL